MHRETKLDFMVLTVYKYIAMNHGGGISLRM